jgi:hypothetical protein
MFITADYLHIRPNQCIMGSNSEEHNNRHRPWQFTLGSLMIGVTLLCVILGLGSWLGLRGYACSALIVIAGVFSYAVFSGHRKLAISCVVLILLPVLYYRFGYWSIAEFTCPICREQQTVIFIGNLNSPLSFEDRRDIGLLASQEGKSKTHQHQWFTVWCSVHHWGGGQEGFDTRPSFSF